MCRRLAAEKASLPLEVSVPQKITKSVKSMVETAKREIEEIEAADAEG